MTKNKNLKILFISRWFPNRADPLNGIFIHRHAIAVSQKHEVAVLYVNADPNMKNKKYDSEYVTGDGITIVRVYYNNSFPDIPIISSIVKFFRYIKSCRTGIKIMNEKFGKPDISHIHVLSRTFLPAYYYNFFHKAPIIISEQWSGYLSEDGTYKGFLKKILTKIAIRKASAVTTVSDSLKNAMLDHGLKNNYSVIPNVVDTQLFFPSLQRMKKDKLIFLHVSNLDDRAKNVSGMINAIKKLSEKRNDFEFHIIGHGDQKSKLETLAGQLNLLNKSVFFLGKKTSNEIAEMMKKADLFLLFSHYDNMPCVMVESFASGLPVIGSAIHGIKDHVKEGMGILVAPGDEHALYLALLKAIHGIESFDKRKLQQYAKENFSYESAAECFDMIYQKIIQK